MKSESVFEPSVPRPSGLRLVIAGGGTGGHVLPALAVVEVLRHQDAIQDVLWIGSRDGLEREAAERAGIEFIAIPTGKLRRYLSISNLVDAFRVPRGLVAARRALRAFRPDVVFSTGGFVSVPTVIAARGIAPVLTHEQTAILGLATRINAHFADVLAVSHAQTRGEARKLHRRVALTGNPVRSSLASGDREQGFQRFGFTASLPLVYITGGARGASPINSRIRAMLPGILEETQILHQTGPASANRDLAELTAIRAGLPDPLRRRYQVVEFVRDELPDVYAACDLVVGRAGAGMVAELAFVGKPSILIPLPGAGGDEQSVNARILGEAGAAVVIPQHGADPERLHTEISGMLSDPHRRAAMAAAACSVSRPDAANLLAEALLDLAPERRPR